MARRMGAGGKWQKTPERETSKRTAPKPVPAGKPKKTPGIGKRK